MPKNLNALPYRPCAGVMLLNQQGLVWVGKRADMPPRSEGEGTWWQMPQGGLDEGEDPFEGALRELYEETSVTSVEKLAETPSWLTYDLPPELLGKAWKGRFRGQKQKWFALRFTGDDSEINIEAPGGGEHKAEFTDWRWLPVDELVSHIVPFKRDVYEQIVRAFAHLAR